MQTPFPPPSDRLQPVRMGLAILLTGSAVLFTGTTAVRLYSVIKADEQQRAEQLHQEILVRGTYLKATQNYSACIAEAQRVPAESLFYSQARTLQDQCQSLSTEMIINRAQAMAAAGQFKDAIAEVKTVFDSTAMAKVQQLVWEWSNRMLQLAESSYLDPSGKFEDAIQIASAILPDNPLYADAQAKIRVWQQQWLTDQTHWQAAQTALNAHQLETALLQAQQITHPYWQQQSTAIINAIYAEQAKAIEASLPVAPSPEASALEHLAWELTQDALNLNSPLLMTFLLPFSMGTLVALSCLNGK